jgi:hypothetical protein
MQPCNRTYYTKFIEGSTCFERELGTQFPSSLDNGRSLYVYINQSLQIQFGAPDDERYVARNMLSLQ